MADVLAQLTHVNLADLDPEAAAFLTRQGHAGHEMLLFPTDASPRRYVRLVGAGLLLMEDPSDPTGFDAFCALSDHLLAMGLSAPRVVAAEPTIQRALVEDFGDATYATSLADGMDETVLYKLAVDALLTLHSSVMASDIKAPRHDLAVLLEGVALVPQWFAPAVAPTQDHSAFERAYMELWRQALAPVADRAVTLVMRDFHVDNLMYLPERSGVAQCGVLDFQDASIGACEYDVMSLLQDARRDISAQLEQDLLQYYCDNAPAGSGGAEAIRFRYAVLGAQRHARIMGLFIRLYQRDAKPAYLQHLPRVISQFQAAAQAAGLTDIIELMDAHMPDWATKGAALTPEILDNLGKD